MPCVYYKYRSQLHNNVIVIDSESTTISSLKEMILDREGLTRSGCAIRVFDVQTCEEFTDGGYVVHRDASVIVSHAVTGDDTPLDLSTSSKSSSHMSPPTLFTSVTKPVEDKKKRKRPDRKISKKIEEKKRQRMKSPKRVKRLKGETTFDHSQVPTDILHCPICKDLKVDATVTPCCGHSFCDGCVRTQLLNSENICFNCSKSLSLDDLVPYYALRWIIKSHEKLYNV